MAAIRTSVLASLLLASAAHAQINLSIVPESSSITISGDASGAPFVEQGPGSLVTSYSGSIVISEPGAAFAFLGANAEAADSGVWSPASGGGIGSAAGNYGLRTTILAFTVDGAVRDLGIGLGSGAIPLAGGSFDASLVTLGFLSGALDYNSPLFSGNRSLAGATGAAGSGMGSVTVAGDDVTLTLPIDSTFLFEANGVPVTLTMRGTIVAVGQIPAPHASVLLGVGVLTLARRRRGARN